MAARELDALDPVPDSKLRQQSADFLAKHHLDELLGSLLEDLLRQQPRDPLQYMIDALTLGCDAARQDPETGLPQHRREQLLLVFRAIDKGGGGISLRSLQAYANKYGGETLTLEDLRGLFADFKPAAEHFVSEGEFLSFFARVSATMTNSDFMAMAKEMMG